MNSISRSGHIVWLCLFLVSACPVSGYALDKAIVLQLNAAEQSYSLDQALTILKDSTRKLTISHVSSPPWSGEFKPAGNTALVIQDPKAAYWVRFRLAPFAPQESKQKSERLFLKLGCPLVALVDFYIPSETISRGFKVIRGGFFRNQPDTSYLTESLVFPLPKNLAEPPTFYMRLKSLNPVVIPFHLETERSLFQKARQETLLLGGFYGLLLALILFNLFLLVSLRIQAIFWYIATLIFTGLFQVGMDGLAREFAPAWSLFLFNNNQLCLWLSFLHLTSIMFAKELLQTKTYLKNWNRSLNILALLWLTAAGACLLLPISLLNDPLDMLVLLSTLAVLGLGITGLIKKIRISGLFLAAVLSSGIGGSLFVLTEWGILAYSAYSYYALHCGLALDALFLSLALSQTVRYLQKKNKVFQKKHDQLEVISLTDSLTGLKNRRFLKKQLPEDIEEAKLKKAPLGLLMMDLDDFKTFNDQFGHQAGDRLLAQLGGLITTNIRGKDWAGRYGGEEFVVVLKGADQDESLIVGERIRTSLESLEFNLADSGKKARQITISIGLANLEPHDNDRTLIGRADQALYQAKAKGKNITIISD